MDQRSLRRLTAALGMLLLGGCATLPAGSVNSPEGGAPEEVRAPASRDQRHPAPSVAAAHLLDKAGGHVRAGDYDLAAANIERALRIEPANAWLYLALAEVRFLAGDEAAGAALIDRARSLGGYDAGVEARARALSAEHARR